MRFLLLAVAGSLFWWGSSLVADTWQPGAQEDPQEVSAARTLNKAIAEVEAASQQLDARVREADVGEDLSNGWEDLRRDTLSMVREMARRPGSSDIDVFAVRVDTFWNVYAPSSGVGPDTSEWRRFETAFRDLVGMRESVEADTSSLAGS